MLVELRNVSVQVDSIYLLRSISIQFGSGLCTAIVGPNGAGKSTLLKTLLGFHRRIVGEVFLEGAPVTSLAPSILSRKLGYVPQRLGDLPDFTVKEFLALCRYENCDAPATVLSAIVPEILLSRRLPSLSGGELQRVLLGGAIAQNAKILLLDEPTNNLDPLAAVEFEEALKTLKAVGGYTVIMVTHDLNLALRCMDAICIMARGEVVWDGRINSTGLYQALETAFGVRFEVYASPEGTSVIQHKRLTCG